MKKRWIFLGIVLALILIMWLVERSMEQAEAKRSDGILNSN